MTDDTDQAVIVGRASWWPVAAGSTRLALAERLLAWEAQMRAAGSLDLLGPSTRRALDRLASGVSPLESGRGGTTNGAAMRIAPVGIACDIERGDGPDRLVDRVAEVSRPTHNSAVAIAGAAAIAAAVSAGVAGRTIAEAVEQADRCRDVAAATEISSNGTIRNARRGRGRDRDGLRLRGRPGGPHHARRSTG